MNYVPFIPRRDAKLVQWSRNFAARIAAAAEYGLTPAQAAQYAALDGAFAAAYAAAVDPATRSAPVVAAKDQARAEVVAEARRLARLIRATPGVTASQRLELGLSARPEGGDAPLIGAPADAPQVVVVSAVGRTVVLRLRNANSPARRGWRGR